MKNSNKKNKWIKITPIVLGAALYFVVRIIINLFK